MEGGEKNGGVPIVGPILDAPKAHTVDDRLGTGMQRDARGRIIGKNKPPPKVYTTETHGRAACVRWVMSHPGTDDVTHEQRYYRRIFDENAAEFGRILREVEREERELAELEKKKREGPGVDDPVEPGSERCLSLIDDVIRGAGHECSGDQLPGSVGDQGS